MGTSSTYEDQGNWTTVKFEKDYSVIKNKITNQSLQLHKVVCNSESQSKREVQMCGKREQCGEQVVKANCENVRSQRAICGEQKMMNVLTEHMNTRLSDYRTIPFSESTFVLKEALAGCKDIKQKLGQQFQVSDRLIGFSEKGQVKVWMHENLAENSPEVPFLEQTTKDPEHSMVDSLFTLMHEKTDGGFPPDFRDHLRLNLHQPFRLSQAIAALDQYESRPPPASSQEQYRPELSFAKHEQQQYFGSELPVQAVVDPRPVDYSSSIKRSTEKKVKELVLNLYSGPGSKH